MIVARLMYCRVLVTARSNTAVLGRQYSIRSLSDLTISEMSYRARGGGYGRRGRGPNRGGGRGQRGGSRGRGAEGHGAPPPAGLSGRALGMWHASRSRARKKARERTEVSTKKCVRTTMYMCGD